MRLLLEIIVIAALIALAWDKPLKEWVSEAPIIGPKIATPAKSAAPVRTVRAAQPVSASTPSGAWMWEHRGTLDRPTKHPRQRRIDDIIRKAGTQEADWIWLR